jgi:hypothetical protein
MELSKKDQIRQRALEDLEFFIRLIHPDRILGHVHQELIRWWTRQEAKTHQLVLLPRDHQKSALAAYRVAWEITKNPAIRVLYISSTSKLAIKQLKFIKDILTSDIYRFYWPEMVSAEESKREKWTETEIAVDHPQRKVEYIRDPTIFTAGLTTTITGLHCDIAVLDDVVVEDNAYTEEGREKVKLQASYLASILGTDSRLWAVGTRYFPSDFYHEMQTMVVEIYGDDGEIIESEQLYETFERQVESHGDGTGQYLWPRNQAPNGKWFGFDQAVLAKKRSQYTDKTRFRAQYYNDPNDISSASIAYDMFQYYDPKYLDCRMGKWYFKESRLNLFAAVDFAFSLRREADFTAIVVVGVDARKNFYVLDVDRFKTNQIKVYFDHLLSLHIKWGFRKVRMETSAAQSIIVKDIKDNYIRVHGLALAVDEFRPSHKEGAKEERIEACLQPKYGNRQIWHYRGGACQLLEQELVSQNPPHDDIKDALCAAVEIAVPPTTGFEYTGASARQIRISAHPRFGGIS